MAGLRQIGGLIALALIAAVSLTAFGWWDPATLVPGTAASAVAGAAGTVVGSPASARGRELYLASCATCHGPDGRGTERGPTLERSGAADWDFYLRSGRMPLENPDQPLEPKPPAFDEAQIEDLVAYGRTLGEGPARPQLVTGTELSAGRELFVNNCAACHGVSASGAAIGPDAFAPSLRGIDPRLIAEAPIVGPGTMPTFDFDDQQLSAIAGYVETLSGDGRGGFDLRGFGPVAEGLVALFIGLAVILLVARWIGSTDASQPGSADGGDDD